MGIQDMDICLNVTADPVVGARKNKQKRKESFKTSIKRLKNQSSQKNIVVNNKESKGNVNTKGTTYQKRIKQKSLSTIFAKKLKETNAINRNVQQQSHLPFQDKSITRKVVESEKVKQTDVTNKKDLKSDKVLSTISSDITNKSILSFTKPTKENISKTLVKKRNTLNDGQKKSNGTNKNNVKSDNVLPIVNSNITYDSIISFSKPTLRGNIGKTLLAKKRNTLDDGQKKSLSDIFSSESNNQNKLKMLSVIPRYNTSQNSNKESKIVPKKSSALEETRKIDILNKKKGKKYKEKVISNNREQNQIPKLIHRASGQISSLFGNNPDVPMIGQRLVKPVNEPVFSEITFADLNIHPYMISNLEKNMNITKMTTVQQKAIPQIFSAKDILVRSQTGSGKTLAYALPIVEFLHKIRPKLSRNSGLSALVVVPTRELALQTYECFIKLVKPFTWIVPGYIVGGEKRKAEKARLRRGCNILIATPGRLLDHIKQTKALRLNEVKYFVLDEADRMLDMGYEKDISGIVSALKVSTSRNDGSEYDPMKIFKQNTKKIFTDKEIADMSKEDNIESCNKLEKNNSCSVKIKQAYHSNDKNDSADQAVDRIQLKPRNKNKKHSDVNKKSGLEAEDIESTEQDCTNVNQSTRQTILLSATLTQAVEKLAGLAMHNPIFVDAAKENLEMNGGDTSEINEDLIVPQSVTQNYIVTPPKLRMVTLSAYIVGRCQSPGQHKILIFMATQDMVDYHTEILSSILTKPIDEDDEDSDSLVDVEFFKLHGNMTHKERTEVFKMFRQAKSGVLLCTDVASRGLDMPKVECVIQYTGPISARDYVHRIGRTARAGCSGTATIFLTPTEIEFVRMLESRRIRIKQQDMNDVLGKLLGPLSKYNSVQAAAIALQNDFENLVLENRQLGQKACKAYLSWVRFYSGYPRDMREIFNRKELHLGHYAKSFALRDPPQRIGVIGKKLYEGESSKPKHNNRLTNKPSDGVPQKKQKSQDGGEKRTGLLKRVRMLNISEYDSGLEPLKRPRK